jgi:hypothetical protein
MVLETGLRLDRMTISFSVLEDTSADGTMKGAHPSIGEARHRNANQI